MIRCVYDAEPNFPASDQHPDAVRHKVGEKWVDVVGTFTDEEVADAVDRMFGRTAIIAKMSELDRKVTPRMLREAALGDESSLQMLRAVQASIEALRLELKNVG